MAGWQCKDRNTISWDGIIQAKQFQGDGSQLTGITSEDFIKIDGTSTTTAQIPFAVGISLGNNLTMNNNDIVNPQYLYYGGTGIIDFTTKFLNNGWWANTLWLGQNSDVDLGTDVWGGINQSRKLLVTGAIYTGIGIGGSSGGAIQFYDSDTDTSLADFGVSVPNLEMGFAARTTNLDINFYGNTGSQGGYEKTLAIVHGSGAGSTKVKLVQETSNGFVKTSNSNGTLIIDTSTYLTSSNISDTAYGASWNGDTTNAPSKNAVYDKIESLGSGSPLTTKGDLYTYSTADARLAVGTNDYVLVADSGETTGLKWASRGFVDRGDASANDYSVGDFTTDGTWRDLDLSSIVPAGAKAVVLRIAIADNLVGQLFAVRKNGNSNARNILETQTLVANQSTRSQGIVACDTNRVIEYFADNTTWTAITLHVMGWFL